MTATRVRLLPPIMAKASKGDDRAAPLDVALRLTSPDIVVLARERLQETGVVHAVAQHDQAALFDWLVGHFVLQGISDRAAASYQLAHGSITWVEVEASLQSHPPCPRLRSWWHFECGYRKATRTCAEPNFIEFCRLPTHDLRKGVLNEAAYGLALFIRDICNGDLVAWVDRRLAIADVSNNRYARGRRMAETIVAELSEIPGTGPKIWSMVLADLLLAGDPTRERWLTAGASMIAVDTMVHAWLHRTGMLRQDGVNHPYGPKCYGAGGCVDVIERFAQTVDARRYNPAFPAYFPRFVQVAIWEFCAEGARNICNGRQNDDRFPCQQIFCPAQNGCARLALHG